MRFEDELPIARGSILWWVVAAGLPFLLVVSVTETLAELSLAVYLGLSLSTLLLALGARTLKWPGMRRSVVADGSGLFVDGQRVLARAAIVRAESVQRDDGLHAVHMQTRYPWRTCVVFVESAEESRALIAALELDIRRVTARFHANLPGVTKYVPVVALVLTGVALLLGFMRTTWGLTGQFALSVLPPLLLARLQRVDVGHDGIFLRWLGKKRFIAFANIERIEKTNAGVELRFRDGGRHDIELPAGAAVQLAELVARIEAGITAQHSRSDAAEEALLMRGGRDEETWLREMRTLGTGEGGGYRRLAIGRERLWDIVENPSVDPSAREGAARALSSELDDDERARLVALAQSTASPTLRVALDGLSREAEEPRLRVALETAEREPETDEPDPAAELRGRAVSRRG